MKFIYEYGVMALLLGMLVGCQTKNTTEAQRFEASVKRELPFQVDSLRWMDGTDPVTFQLASRSYVPTLPDTEFSREGEVSVFRTFLFETPLRQTEDKVWRNVVFSKKNQRFICIDRYLRDGRTLGYVYVLQCESKKFPTIGKYHWDVSDPHHVEILGGTLEHLRGLTLRRIKGGDQYVAPASQEDYWALIFHADSLWNDGLYAEAKQMYDLAFTEDRYILPSYLSAVAMKMMAVGNEEAALSYLKHRVALEPDFYEEPSLCSFPQLKDTFEVRQRKWGYDLNLKQDLEWIIQRDNYDRMLWFLAYSKAPKQVERNEKLARQSQETDTMNLERVSRILTETGYPRRSKVGYFAAQAVWLVIQHSDLSKIKEFLPQLEEAARQGEIEPALIATTKDRIDVREGRLQKYGTQRDGNGKLCPLLDASRVNEWRKEVGLPPIGM